MVAGQVAAVVVPILRALRVTIVGLALGVSGLALPAGIWSDTTFGPHILPGLVRLTVGSGIRLRRHGSTRRQ